MKERKKKKKTGKIECKRARRFHSLRGQISRLKMALMTVHFVSSPSAVSFLSIVRVGTFLRLLHSRHHHTTFFPRSTVHTERSSPNLMNCCVREEQHPRLITSLRLKNRIIETMYWFHSYGHYIC